MKVNKDRLLLYSSSSVCFLIIIYGVSIYLVINNNDAFAITSNNRNSLLIHSKGFQNNIMLSDYAQDIIYHDKASTADMALFHRISFAEDTLFPQTFQSSGTSSNDITLSNGKTLPARPITLTVNKLQANNTLVLTLHSLNDKYLLTGDLKGSAKPTANSNADSAQFALKGTIIIDKSTSYPVLATLAEDKSKQITLSITDAKTPSNFKVTIDFSPPRTEQPLAE